ncbi:MAG: response regulator [Bacteroidota bacterium]
MNKMTNRILVIDDDPDISMLIKTILEYRGFSVVTERAEEAENLLRTKQFDLLIMDMLLSGINGIDICTRLKQDKSLSHIPVIIISAHPNAREISLNAGAEDFISKPFDMEEIVSKVREFMSVA